MVSLSAAEEECAAASASDALCPSGELPLPACKDARGRKTHVASFPPHSLPAHLCWTYSWSLRDRLAAVSARVRSGSIGVGVVTGVASDTLEQVLHLDRALRLADDLRRFDREVSPSGGAACAGVRCAFVCLFFRSMRPFGLMR